MTSLPASDSNDKNKYQYQETDKFSYRFEISLPQIKSGMDYSVELILKNLTQESFEILEVHTIQLDERKTGLSSCKTEAQRLIALEKRKENLLQHISEISYYFSLRGQKSDISYPLRELLFLFNFFVFSILKNFPGRKKLNIWEDIKNKSSIKGFRKRQSEKKRNWDYIPQQARIYFDELNYELDIVLQEIKDIRKSPNIIHSQKELSIALYLGKAPRVNRIEKHEIIVKILYRAINSDRDDFSKLSKHIQIYPPFVCLILSVVVGAFATCAIILFYLWINHPDILETNLQKEAINFLFRIFITFLLAIPILGAPKTVTEMLNRTNKLPDNPIVEFSQSKLISRLIRRINRADTTDGFLLGIILSMLVDSIPFENFIGPIS